MAGITLADAEAKLALYLAALDKILLGQEVQIEGQTLKRANLKDVESGVDYWNGKVRELSERASGRGRSRTVSPGF